VRTNSAKGKATARQMRDRGTIALSTDEIMALTRGDE
jgi:hypothetical protein